MPHIRPFKGIIYNKKMVRNIASVVAPPYDIIPARLQDGLYRKSPYNIVRLELNRVEPSDTASDNRYTRARSFFESWLKRRIMTQDEKPAFYVYSQRYYDGSRDIERTGFICLMDIEDRSGRKVLPHENTLMAPKTDRLKLMREVKANLSPIFILYEDARHEVVRLLKYHREKKPFMDVVFEGVRNTAWRIQDGKAIARISRIMAGRETFIADGHHRFEVSRMYSAEAGTTGSKYVMVYFVESDENMLTVLPAHRLVADIGGLEKERIKELLGKFFRIEKKKGMKPLMAALKRHAGSHAFGMCLGKGDLYLLVLKDVKAIDGAIKGKPREWKMLDVSILHLFIFQHILGIRDDDDNIEFIKSPQETAALVYKGKFPIAFFLNPTKVSEVKRIARLCEKMPRKATYFYPKPISGVVINKH